MNSIVCEVRYDARKLLEESVFTFGNLLVTFSKHFKIVFVIIKSSGCVKKCFRGSIEKKKKEEAKSIETHI